MGFSNLRIGTRLAIGFSTVSVLLLMIVAIGVSRLSVLNDGTSEITNSNWPKIDKAHELFAHTNSIAISLRNMMLTEDAADRQKQHDLILDARKQSSVAMDKLQTSLIDAKEKELFQKLLEGRAKYITGQEKLIQLITAENVDDSKAYLREALIN